jgi:hypothetical protein
MTISRATSLVLVALMLITGGARAEGRKAQGTRQKPKVVKAVTPPPPVREEPLSLPSAPDKDKGPTKETRDRGCLLGDFCFGPQITLGAVNAFGIGLAARYGPRFGFALDYQATPAIGINTRIGLSAVSATARFYLTEGLFLYGGLARQMASIQMTESGVTADADASLTGPVFGAGYMTSSGFLLGIDLGLMVPISRQTRTSFNTGQIPYGISYEPARQAAEDRVLSLVNDVPVVPQLNLLRVGYLF